MRDLTHKERLAADAHIAGATYLDAYRVAYSTERMAYKTARCRASEVFARPHVRAYVDAANRKAATAAVCSKAEVMEVLSRIVRGSTKDYVRPDGTITLEALRQSGQEVESVQVDETPSGPRVKVRMRDPIRAAERLAKMLDWDSAERHEVSGVTFTLDMAGRAGGGKAKEGGA